MVLPNSVLNTSLSSGFEIFCYVLVSIFNLISTGFKNVGWVFKCVAITICVYKFVRICMIQNFGFLIDNKSSSWDGTFSVRPFALIGKQRLCSLTNKQVIVADASDKSKNWWVRKPSKVRTWTFFAVSGRLASSQ